MECFFLGGLGLGGGGGRGGGMPLATEMKTSQRCFSQWHSFPEP